MSKTEDDTTTGKRSQRVSESGRGELHDAVGNGEVDGVIPSVGDWSVDDEVSDAPTSSSPVIGDPLLSITNTETLPVVEYDDDVEAPSVDGPAELPADTDSADDSGFTWTDTTPYGAMSEDLAIDDNDDAVSDVDLDRTGPIPVVTRLVPRPPTAAGSTAVPATHEMPEQLRPIRDLADVDHAFDPSTIDESFSFGQPVPTAVDHVVTAYPAARQSPSFAPVSEPTTSHRKSRVRKVTRVLRHVDPWSTFKVGLVFSFVGYLILMTSGVLLWNVASRTGTLANVERWFTQFGWETFSLDGASIFRNAAVAGLFLAVGATGAMVMFATVFNLVSDAIGGIRLTVLEDEVVERFNDGDAYPSFGSANATPARGIAADWDVD